jgi:hypothetical protein
MHRSRTCGLRETFGKFAGHVRENVETRTPATIRQYFRKSLSRNKEEEYFLKGLLSHHRTRAPPTCVREEIDGT